METVTIQINNDKAYKLLKDLEDLDIIKVISKQTEKKDKLSDKYRGSLTIEDGQSLDQHIKDMRQEWNNI
jgi:hypothetical protein